MRLILFASLGFVAAIAHAQTPTMNCDAREDSALGQSHGAAVRVSVRRLTVRWAAGTATFDSDSIQDFGSLGYWYCGFNAAVGFHLIHKADDRAFSGILLSQATGKVLPAGQEVMFAPDGSQYFASEQLDGHEGPDWYVYTKDGVVLWKGQAEHPPGGLDYPVVGILDKPRWTAKSEIQATLKCPTSHDWQLSTVTLTQSNGGWTWMPSLRCHFQQARVTMSTVLLEPGAARLGDTTSGVVFVTRDLFSPAEALTFTRIAVGPPASDVFGNPSRTIEPDRNGMARLVGFDGDSLDVDVLRVGYEEVRFSLRLARRCRETIEVYMRPAVAIDGAARTAPPASARVVRTTCAPPA